MSNRSLDKILNEVSLDSRVTNGIFNIEENDHMDALRDYLLKRGIDEDAVKTFSNRVLEGKYPERQAYNAKGILVTFPTPEYKQAAIKRGTHFEKDPTKGSSNLFSDKPAAAPPPEKKTSDTPDTPDKDQPKTNLPVSQASPPSTDATPAQPVQAKTTAAPQQTPQTTPAAEEPELKEPTELPPPEPKSPQEKDANKQAIKTMLKGDDYMLERVIDYLLNPVSNHYHILEEIRKRL